MGRESEQQKISMDALALMGTMLRESLMNLDRVVEFGKRNNVDSLTVRQVPKGKRALEDLLDFTALLNVTLVHQVLPAPTKQPRRNVESKLREAESIVAALESSKPKPKKDTPE